jgi:hypothetical protein
VHLSFVLLPSLRHISGPSIVASHAELLPDAQRPLVSPTDGSITELRHHDGLTTHLLPMPAAVPNGEADTAAKLSLAAFSNQFGPLPSHGAHIVVTSHGAPAGASASDTLTRHTRIVAACAEALGAVAVYEGNACATHPTPFYVDVVASSERPLMVWTGISLAQEPSGRVSLLTLGIENMLGLPDVLVGAARGKANAALGFAFDILAYIIDRGSALPDGDTIGRTATEKRQVRYVPAPHDASRRVMRIDLP